LRCLQFYLKNLLNQLLSQPEARSLLGNQKLEEQGGLDNGRAFIPLIEIHSPPTPTKSSADQANCSSKVRTEGREDWEEFDEWLIRDFNATSHAEKRFHSELAKATSAAYPANKKDWTTFNTNLVPLVMSLAEAVSGTQNMCCLWTASDRHGS